MVRLLTSSMFSGLDLPNKQHIGACVCKCEGCEGCEADSVVEEGGGGKQHSGRGGG
jgi:hypothetical protein